jgi:hypothetical protein
MELNLLDAERQNREHPDSIEIPSREIRYALPPGADVKLCFLGRDGAARIWVQDVRTEGDFYVGTLRRNPLHEAGAGFGDIIRFEPRHIIDAWIPDED